MIKGRGNKGMRGLLVPTVSVGTHWLAALRPFRKPRCLGRRQAMQGPGVSAQIRTSHAEKHALTTRTAMNASRSCRWASRRGWLTVFLCLARLA